MAFDARDIEINPDDYVRYVDTGTIGKIVDVKTDIIPLVVGVKRLGRKRARNMVNVFGENLKSASEKELQQVEGIGPKLAEKIKLFINS